MTWKQLTERDCSEWKLSTITPHDRHTWRSGVRSAICAASQLSGRGPTDVDAALYLHINQKSDDDDDDDDLTHIRRYVFSHFGYYILYAPSCGAATYQYMTMSRQGRKCTLLNMQPDMKVKAQISSCFCAAGAFQFRWCIWILHNLKNQ